MRAERRRASALRYNESTRPTPHPYSPEPLLPAIRLRRDHLNEMIAHALEDAPLECCGILATKAGVVDSVNRARNIEASPYRFKIDPLAYAKLERALDEVGATPAAFYHSHTGSDAVPSPTDVRMMGTFFGPPFVHFVVGVKDREHPVVRCWYIDGGDKTEQKFEIIE